ncbi:MAG: DUF1080 domain-containing protein [Bacteroidia bacterium]
MIRLIPLIFLLLTSCLSPTTSTTSVVQQWEPLFNGKNFKGWFPVPGGTWEVTDGMILGKSSAGEKRHGLLVTEGRYKDFTVRLKYKAVKGNSGLYFRVDTVSDAVGVHGFQAEIDPEKDAGGLYETGGRAWVVKPDSAAVATWYKPGEWNEMSVKAAGGDITVMVNDSVTARLTHDPGRLEGHIALQLHGGMDMEVWFKDVEIMK